MRGGHAEAWALSSTTAIGKNETLSVFAGAQFPGGGKDDWSAGFRYRTGLRPNRAGSSTSRMYRGAGRLRACVEASTWATVGAQAAAGIGCNCARHSSQANCTPPRRPGPDLCVLSQSDGENVMS